MQKSFSFIGTILKIRRATLPVALTFLLIPFSRSVANQNPMLQGLGWWKSSVLFTIGEALPSSRSVNNSYYPPGVPDGMGATRLENGLVRIFLNHELSPASGYGYLLEAESGDKFPVAGARISFIDIDPSDRRIVDSGPAYDRVINRLGKVVGPSRDFGDGVNNQLGLAKLCSSTFYEANSFGPGRGFADAIYLTGEEWLFEPGGSVCALFPKDRTLIQLPDLGYGGWENVTLIDTGESDHVALLLADDYALAPLYLYIGKKIPGDDRLARNGLSGGQLFAWISLDGSNNPGEFRGIGETRSGRWLPVPQKFFGSGEPPDSTDSVGYFTALALRRSALHRGAFRFSRPEDMATDPSDPTRAVFATTGAGNLFPDDNWGTTYLVDTSLEFDDSTGAFDSVNSRTSLTIIYNADQSDGDLGIRNPDNLDWASSGRIVIQEDSYSFLHPFAAESGIEASIWGLDPDGSRATRMAVITRSPSNGSTDIHADIPGAWESSGIIDVSSFFDSPPGSLFLTTVQAHGIHDGPIHANGLFEGGQILFLENQVTTGHASFQASGWSQFSVPSQSNQISRDPDLFPFSFGVASADPSANSIHLWTRYENQTTSHEIFWQISKSPDFSEILLSNISSTPDDMQDYENIPVHAYVDGLTPDTIYYYRFHDGVSWSMVGRTRTMPSASVNADPDSVNLLFASCANFETGSYVGYGAMGRFPDIHALIFLGDFIYESASLPDGDPRRSGDRFHQPVQKAVTFMDYDQRYASYLMDKDLLFCRSAHPFIQILDDHEVTDGSWADGALSHIPETDGDYQERRRVALKAFRGWVPAPDPEMPLFRKFSFGSLVDLMAIDTRHTGRDPLIIDPFDPALSAPDRTMLGAEQRTWLLDNLSSSNANWKLIANQVLFSELNLWFGAPFLGLTAPQLEASLLDSWDGYPAERSQILDWLNSSPVENLLFFTGDTHSSWAFEVVDNVDTINPDSTLSDRYDPVTGTGSIALEFGVPSLTSGNWDEFFMTQGHSAERAIDLTSFLQSNINKPITLLGGINPNPHLKYTNLMDHGFVHASFTKSATKVRYFLNSLENVNSHTPEASFLINLGKTLIHPIHPALSYDEWMSLYYPVGPNQAPSDRKPDQDADLDGMSNGEEFIFGTNPLVADDSPLHILLESEIMKITFPVNIHLAPQSLNVNILGSQDISGPWSSLDSDNFNIATGAGMMDPATFTINVSLQQNISNQFYIFQFTINHED